MDITSVRAWYGSTACLEASICSHFMPQPCRVLHCRMGPKHCKRLGQCAATEMPSCLWSCLLRALSEHMLMLSIAAITSASMLSTRVHRILLHMW